MNSQIEIAAAKLSLASLGAFGTINVIIPDDDKIVTATNMANIAYTIAAQPDSPSALSVTVTAGDTADTMGTLAVVGSCGGTAYTETITPVAGSTVYSVNVYDTITSITGSGWVIDAAESTNDTIKIGVATRAPSGYYFSGIMAVAGSTAVSAQTNVTSSYTINSDFCADLTDITAIPSGAFIPCKATALSISAGEAIAYLSRL